MKLTLTGAVTTTTFAGAFAHFDLAGNVYNGVQAIRGREGAFTAGHVRGGDPRCRDEPADQCVRDEAVSECDEHRREFRRAQRGTGIDKGADALVAQFD